MKGGHRCGRSRSRLVVWGLCAVAGVVAVLGAGEQAARAQAIDLRVGVGLEGRVKVNGEGSELDPSIGGDADYVREVAPHVALGGGLGVWSWITEEGNEADGSRNLFVDLTFRPEGFIDVVDNTQMFLALPLGPSYSTIGDDKFLGGDIDPAFGFHVALEVGARILLASRGGLVIALGVIHHDAEHEVDTILGSGTLDGSMTQFLLRVGGFFYAGP